MLRELFRDWCFPITELNAPLDQGHDNLFLYLSKLSMLRELFRDWCFPITELNAPLDQGHDNLFQMVHNK